MNRCAVIAFLLFLLTAAGSGVTQKHVDISRPDGTDIRGTYYDDAGRPGPGILLLHMCNSERQAWRELAKLLAADGFHVLAIDYRGYGESGGDRFLQETQKQARLTAEKWPGDIDAAFTFLLRQPGVREEAVGVAGGSCGVNHAIHTARRHSEVHSLVLLAGPTDLEAEEFLLQNRWLPLFTAAAADDFYGAGLVDTMRWVADVTGNPRNRFVSYPTGGHGTMMFGEHPELMTQIVAWFRQTLVTAPASPQESSPTRRRRSRASGRRCSRPATRPRQRRSIARRGSTTRALTCSPKHS